MSAFLVVAWPKRKSGPATVLEDDLNIENIKNSLFVVTSSQLMTGPLLSPSTLTTCRLFHVVNFKTDFFSATINECAPFWKRIQRQIRLILHLSYLLYWCQILFLKYTHLLGSKWCHSNAGKVNLPFCQTQNKIPFCSSNKLMEEHRIIMKLFMFFEIGERTNISWELFT